METILRLGYEQPGQESTQCERKACAGDDIGGKKTEESDTESKELAIAKQDDLLENGGKDESPYHNETYNGCEAPPQRSPANGLTGVGPGQYGHQQHEGYDAQVLEEQNAHGNASGRCIELPAVGVHPEDDRGGG